MVEQTKSFILCPKCKEPAYKLFNKNEIEAKYVDDLTTQIKMKRQYQCSDHENCAHVFEVSFKEVALAFAEMRREEGKTNQEILAELVKENAKLVGGKKQ